MKFYTCAFGFGDDRFECIALACITYQCQCDWTTSMRVSILISKRFSGNISIDVCAYLKRHTCPITYVLNQIFRHSSGNTTVAVAILRWMTSIKLSSSLSFLIFKIFFFHSNGHLRMYEFTWLCLGTPRSEHCERVNHHLP